MKKFERTLLSFQRSFLNIANASAALRGRASILDKFYLSADTAKVVAYI
jgi:hypothetical protein